MESNSTKGRIFNTLYWQISGIFLVLLMVVGLAYAIITGYNADVYFHETNQRLNAQLAENIASGILSKAPSIVSDGSINKKDIDSVNTLISHVVFTNPILDIYLLDKEGKILSHYPEENELAMESVRTGPINVFLEKKAANQINGCIIGDNPTGGHRVFSAAELKNNNGELGAYLYVVLGSQRFASATDHFFTSYVMRVSAILLVLSLLVAAMIGLFAIWVITKNLRNVVKTVRDFEQGDLNARVDLSGSKGEMKVLGESINNMADTIVANIEELQSSAKLKRELIANVSHDLRTPLAVIHGYIETLIMKQENIVPEERRKYLDILMQSTKKLKKQVSELFELSKLEAKQIKPKLEPFSMGDLLQDSVFKYNVIAQEKNIKMHQEVPIPMQRVVGDISLIDRVIQNLLDNAIKFTPPDGQITVRAEQKNESIRVSISDSGMGIPDEKINQVFDRYISHASNGDNSSGSGLGLAIVKKVLELHDSDIEVRSKVNQGATFTFELPLCKNCNPI